MFSIEQSLFLRALGQAISHSLWQVAALWLAYAAISNVGKWSANRKYTLAATASLAGFVWFVYTLAKSYYTLPPLQTLTGVYADSSAEPGSSLPECLRFMYHSTAISLRSLMPYISCAYLLLFVVLSIRLTNGFRQVKLFATQGLEKTSVEWRLFVQQHAAALGIVKTVKIFTSQYVQSPLTLGFWKPIILMPVASLANLTTAQIESILLHELAHIRRHDYLVNIFLQIAETALFFNPFMRLLLKQVKQERENSCDDYVLQFQYSPKDYAKALLAVEHNKNPALLALAAKGNQSFQLLNRVRRMVAPQPKAFSYRQQLSLLLLLTILTLGFTVIIPHPKKAAQAKNSLTIATKKVATQAEEPIINSEKPAENIPLPPVPPPAINVVNEALQGFTNENNFIDEAAVQATTKAIEAQSKEIGAWGEAYGKKVEAQMKPMESKWAEWGNQMAKLYENGTMPDAQTQEAMFKKMPVSTLSIVADAFPKKMMDKLNALVKLIPTKAYAAMAKQATAEAKQYQLSEIDRQLSTIDEKKMAEQYTEDARQQVEQARQDLENARLQLEAQEEQRELIKEGQAAAKYQMKIEKAAQEKLRLGLFTDDRDTTLSVLNGMLAKLDKKFHWSRSAKNSLLQPDVQVSNKDGKCVITIPDINISLNETFDLPTNLNLDGQNLDICHDKQVKNGKEEKVMVISIK